MSFAENWRRAGEEQDDFEPPAGNYKVLVTGGSAFTSRAGDDYAKVNLQILGSDKTDTELVGRQFQHFMGFKHEVGARINREALLTYGLKNPEGIEDIDDLDTAISALAGTEAEIGVSYKDGYIQIRVFGSRAPDAESDVPSGFSARTDGQSQASFAAAASRDDDEPAF